MHCFVPLLPCVFGISGGKINLQLAYWSHKEEIFTRNTSTNRYVNGTIFEVAISMHVFVLFQEYSRFDSFIYMDVFIPADEKQYVCD